MSSPKKKTKMIVPFSIAASLLLTGAVAHAFPGHTRQPVSPEQRIERLQKDLALTDAQVEKVRDLMTKDQTQRENILTRYGLDQEKFQALSKELQATRGNFFQGLQGILTDEQKKELRQQQHQHKRHHPQLSEGK